MMPGAEFDGPITLTVRLDQDGNASTAEVDIEGVIETHADAKNVKLVLNHIIGG